jgi:ABC-type dipeptide/oligopeptide/nickel transport system permease component
MIFILVRSLNYPWPSSSPGSTDFSNYEAYKESIGANKPVLVQLFMYLGKILKGDFGKSLKNLQPVTQIFIGKLPYTVVVNLFSIIVSIPLGLLLGILAALRKNKIEDQIISVGVIFFISVPSFVYSLLFQVYLGHVLNIGTIEIGRISDFWSVFQPKFLQSILLPMLSLAVGSIAGIARYTRAELTEVLTCEFMFLARTKGLTRGQATVRHAMRNSMVPIFPMLLGEFIGVLGGSMIIEQLYSVPGVGPLYLEALNGRDYDLFMFLCIFYVSVGLLAGLIVDLSYGFVDPRIRMGGGKK